MPHRLTGALRISPPPQTKETSVFGQALAMESHRSLRFRPQTKLSLDMLLQCYKIRPNQLPAKGPYLYAGNFYSSFRGLGFSLPTRSHGGLSVADATDKFEGFVFTEGRFE